MNLGHVRMPFGKHKGKRFDQVPLKYLDWLVGQSNLYGNFKNQLEAYLKQPEIQHELRQELAADE